MTQDTGSAIVGAVRADYFWGWGLEAEAQAGRMKQGLRVLGAVAERGGAALRSRLLESDRPVFQGSPSQ